MTDQNITKSQLRAQMKRVLCSLSDLEKDLESQQVVEKITHFIKASLGIKTVASYAAMTNEVNLDALHDTLPEVSFCYPRCKDEGRMEFHSVRVPSDMDVSEYGIREPAEIQHPQVEPNAIDLFLCPAYAYTPDGKRLGKGGGYYDRYLISKRSDAITLGIVFPCQIVAHVPTEAHDLLIDRVL